MTIGICFKPEWITVFPANYSRCDFVFGSAFCVKRDFPLMKTTTCLLILLCAFTLQGAEPSFAETKEWIELNIDALLAAEKEDYGKFTSHSDYEFMDLEGPYLRFVSRLEMSGVGASTIGVPDETYYRHILTINLLVVEVTKHEKDDFILFSCEEISKGIKSMAVTSNDPTTSKFPRYLDIRRIKCISNEARDRLLNAINCYQDLIRKESVDPNLF